MSQAFKVVLYQIPSTGKNGDTQTIIARETGKNPHNPLMNYLGFCIASQLGEIICCKLHTAVEKSWR